MLGQFLVLFNIPMMLMGQVTISWLAILLPILAPGPFRKVCWILCCQEKGLAGGRGPVSS